MLSLAVLVLAKVLFSTFLEAWIHLVVVKFFLMEETFPLFQLEKEFPIERIMLALFFRPINLINDLTAEENVELARLNKNCLSAKEALSLMDLSDKFEAYPDELSGGQKQRVSIARAIVKKPTILLCDEPTGALDYQSGKLVLSYLEKLVKEQSQTIVLVTHTRAIGDMADRVIVMRNGQIEDTIINDNPLSADKVNW